MSYNYQQLESDLGGLLGALSSFTPAETAEVAEFLAAGEYGLAFETLCGIAKEENKHVPAELRSKLRELGERMEIDPIWWEELTKDG